MGKKLHVGNLTYSSTSSDLQGWFTPFGTVQIAQVISDRETGRSKGFGFVEMDTDAQAEAAIQGLNGHEHEGRRLIVSEAKPRVGRKGVVDELSTRRSRFQPGTPICLANDQEWTFPAPTADSEFAVESAEAQYMGLIHAVQEAEDQSERRLAELALASFVIGLNYQLSSTDLANLFTFQPRSQKLADSQHAFESLARDHILSLARRGEPYLPVPSPGAERRPLGRRALAWLRSLGLMRKGLPNSRNGEALL